MRAGVAPVGSAQEAPAEMLPRALRKAGPLPAGKAVVGRILTTTTRRVAEAGSQIGLPPASAAPILAKGAKSAKGANGKKGSGKGAFSDSVWEVYICGGNSAADVLLFEVWDAAVRERLQPCCRLGAVVRITQCLVVLHTDKTKWFSTSRAPVYLKASHETTMEEIANMPDFLQYHPVTPIPSLPRLEPKALVCVAGRVLPPTPEIAYVTTPEGETNVAVAHLMLRAHTDIVEVSFWRDTVQHLEEPCVEVGRLVMISSVAKQFPGKDMDPRRHASLRAMKRTSIADCPEALRQSLESTPTSAEGATMWSPESMQRRDYSTSKAEWMSLSVLESLCSRRQTRDIQQVFQVPSVLLDVEAPPTYMACSRCQKAWADAAWPPCLCWPQGQVAPEARRPRWRAKLVLRDGTASLKATCFGAFQAVADIAANAFQPVAEVAANGAGVSAEPEGWQDEAVVAQAFAYVGAVPFTVLVTLAGDTWNEGLQATVQLIQETYAGMGVSHPMKAFVQLAPTDGACPPCKLSDTSFDAGIGLTVVYGIALQQFRAMVKLCDAAVGIAGSGGLGCVREISCAFATGQTYKVDVYEDDVGRRLRAIAQDGYVHAVMAWASTERLSMTAFVPAPIPIDGFQKFFAHEIALQAEAVRLGPSFTPAMADTPRRILSAAESANFTSPPLWKVRKTVGEA